MGNSPSDSNIYLRDDDDFRRRNFRILDRKLFHSVDTSNSGNLLCLDGGGIRGLVEARMLQYIEEFTNRPIKESFEWIAGTSTGGILALYLSLGHKAEECIELYHKLKDSVFGSKAYKDVSHFITTGNHVEAYNKSREDLTKNLEKVLKEVFGEDKRMYSIKDVKVIITVTLGKQDPLELVHYSNFDDKTSDKLIWKVARATSAAPGYFTRFEIDEVGPLFDGGLLANNPTLTAFSQIVKYYDIYVFKKPVLRRTMSLGTGIMPIIHTQLPDIPIGYYDTLKKFLSGELKILFNMLSNELTRSNGYVVDQAEAFCKMGDVKYVRFNPQLDEYIKLDETNEEKLLKMMEKLEQYINEHKDDFENFFLL